MTNIFMGLVNDSMEFSFTHFFKWVKYKKKYKKFCNSITNGSPSLGVLWYFAEFIKYSEIIFFYDNSKDNWLYSSNSYDPGENGFRITTDEFIITVKLYSDSQTVGIDVENKKGGHVKTSYKFENGQWTSPPDEYDLLHVNTIIEIINRSMIRLLDFSIYRNLYYDPFNNDTDCVDIYDNLFY